MSFTPEDLQFLKRFTMVGGNALDDPIDNKEKGASIISDITDTVRDNINKVTDKTDALIDEFKQQFGTVNKNDIESFDPKKHRLQALIYDTMKDSNTETLLRKQQMTDLEKRITLNILKHCAKPYNNPFAKLVKEAKTYDQLKSWIQGCYSDECLLMYAVLNFHVKPRSLLMENIAIHSRVMPLENGKDTWFSNFTLNSYLEQMLTFTYDKYDDNSDPAMYSVPTPNGKLVNKNVKLTNPKRLLFFFGTVYREFLEFKTESDVSDSQAVEMLDKLNAKYPFSTGLAHGCDVFDIPDKSPNIKDISEYCSRYPYSIVAYILNTKSYASGKGQHWVAVLFRYKTVYLICSEGSDFDCFDTYKKMVDDFDNNGISKENNLKKFQHDPSSCGMYSVLSVLCFLIDSFKHEKPDIKRVVDMVGDGAEELNGGGIYSIKKKLCGY